MYRNGSSKTAFLDNAFEIVNVEICEFSNSIRKCNQVKVELLMFKPIKVKKPLSGTKHS